MPYSGYFNHRAFIITIQLSHRFSGILIAQNSSIWLPCYRFDYLFNDLVVVRSPIWNVDWNVFATLSSFVAWHELIRMTIEYWTPKFCNDSKFISFAIKKNSNTKLQSLIKFCLKTMTILLIVRTSCSRPYQIISNKSMMTGKQATSWSRIFVPVIRSSLIPALSELTIT
jgi:hypothetical protein